MVCKGTHQPLQYPAADPAFPPELQNLQCSALAILSPSPKNSSVQGEVHCLNWEVEGFQRSTSAQGGIHSAVGPDPGGCVGWGHSNASRCVCEEVWVAQPLPCCQGLRQLFYLAGGEGLRESGRQEKEVISWDLCSLWVCADPPPQAGETFLQHFDGGAGRTTEGENAGGFILKANRIKRRSLDAIWTWMWDGGDESLSCKIDEG